MGTEGERVGEERPDARRFARFPVAIPVIGRTAQYPGREFAGMVRNVSAGGLMAEFPVQMAPAGEVELVLQTRRGPLEVKARVVWTSATASAVGHGFAFPEPKGDSFALDLFIGDSRREGEDRTGRFSP